MATGTKGSLHVPIAKMSRTIVIHGINDLCPIWHCPTALLPELQQTLSPALVIVVLSRGFGRSDGSVISSLPEQINDFLYNFLTCPFNGITLVLAGGRIGRGPARNGQILVFLFFAVHFNNQGTF